MRFVFFLAIVLAHAAAANELHSSTTALLRRRRLPLGATRDQGRVLQTLGAVSSGAPGNPQPFFVSYGDIATRAKLYAYLSKQSVRVHSYIPNNTWVVHASASILAKAVARGLASSVIPFNAEDKIAPEWSDLIGGRQPLDTGAVTGVPGGSQGPAGSSANNIAASALPRDGDGSFQANTGLTDQEGRLRPTQLAVAAQLFSATAAAARALAAQLASSWQQPLASAVRDAALERRSAAAAPSTASAAAAEPNVLTSPACAPRLTARGRLLHAALCAPDVAAALSWLAAQPEVHWLEPAPRLLRRDIWGAALALSGGRGLDGGAAAQPAGLLAAHGLWAAGIDGSSQLVGVSDTGVDMDSCYFFDPQIPDVWRRLVPDPARAGAKVFKSTSHRKLASYYAYSDFGDARGHGTHVSGIALGACYPPDYSNSSNSSSSDGVFERSLEPPPPPSPPPSPRPPSLPPSPRPPKPSPPPPTPRPPSRQPPSPGPPLPPPKKPKKRPPPPPPPRPRPPSPLQPPKGASTRGGSASRHNRRRLLAGQQGPRYVVDDATGIAPGARLAFYDIMDRTGAWAAFSYEDLLQYQSDAGVFVESDSWGRDKTYNYDTLCKQLDEVTWRNPQLLVVTAAGNDGDLQPAPAAGGTVSSPANAKNTLSVGSSTSLTPSGLNQGALLLLVWTGDPTPPDVDPDVVAALLLEAGSGSGGAGGTAALVAGTGGQSDGSDAAAPPVESGREQTGAPAAPVSAPLSTLSAARQPPQAPPSPVEQQAQRPAPPMPSPAAPGPAPSPPPASTGTALNDIVQLQILTEFRTLRDLDGVVLEAVAASPANACRPLSRAGPPPVAATAASPPKIYAMLGGDCMNYVKVLAAAAAGGAAAAVVNTAPGPMPRQPNPTNATLPLAPLSQALGARVLAALASGQRVFMRASWQPQPPYDNVAWYSSYGPTADGRIKPDVVAPGTDVLSAYSDMVSVGQSDQCKERWVLSGTSMSAPLVAGAAVLAREYFTMGFYPYGHNNTPGAAPFAPSGMLLKAVLVGGAYGMKGMSSGNLQTLQPAPSAYQGYGRVDLSASLPLSAPAGTPSQPQPPPPAPGSASCAAPRLQLVDMVPIEEGETHTYRLTATGTGPVVVTLVWVDAPADPMAAVALVNDLDLEVKLTPPAAAGVAAAATAAAPVTCLGNAGWTCAAGGGNVSSGGSGSGSGGGSGSRAGADARNNVERVQVPAGARGALQVRVLAVAINSRFVSRFASDVQRYALTVHGCFSGLLASPYNPDVRAQPPAPPPSPPRPPSPSPSAPPQPPSAPQPPSVQANAAKCRRPNRPCATPVAQS